MVCDKLETLLPIIVHWHTRISTVANVAERVARAISNIWLVWEHSIESQIMGHKILHFWSYQAFGLIPNPLEMGRNFCMSALEYLSIFSVRKHGI